MSLPETPARGGSAPCPRATPAEAAARRRVFHSRSGRAGVPAATKVRAGDPAAAGRRHDGLPSERVALPHCLTTFSTGASRCRAAVVRLPARDRSDGGRAGRSAARRRGVGSGARSLRRVGGFATLGRRPSRSNGRPPAALSCAGAN
jgi:hypothetical protein